MFNQKMVFIMHSLTHSHTHLTFVLKLLRQEIIFFVLKAGKRKMRFPAFLFFQFRHYELLQEVKNHIFYKIVNS